MSCPFKFALWLEKKNVSQSAPMKKVTKNKIKNSVRLYLIKTKGGKKRLKTHRCGGILKYTCKGKKYIADRGVEWVPEREE